jgi:ABC-type multidrug transport system fused ATPase/permease subunit
LQGETNSLTRSALLLFGLGLASAILNLGHRYWSEWIAVRVGYDLRNRMYDHIQHLPFTYHDHVQSGQLISRCIEDVRSIERFAGGALAELRSYCWCSESYIYALSRSTLAVISLPPMMLLIIMTSVRDQIGRLFTWMPRGEVSTVCRKCGGWRWSVPLLGG